MSPTYAVVTLAYLEENLYEIISEKYGNNLKEFMNHFKFILVSASYFGNNHVETSKNYTNCYKTYTPK